ncbi:hypothetical protein LOD99_9631 [Oopsacas minuta]|uniref:Large ribosomal subunit protein bL9m n=1 Tax=Oopsacas minuta TaxID=111878 RepID=A0AAV7KTB4_9METZ|nr:hypothetical protein LOD99_9631 [Oopsacas minuta]
MNLVSLTKPLSSYFYVQVFSRIQVAWVGQIRESKKFIQHPNRDRRLPIYMLTDVEAVGLKGEIVWVLPGTARNHLIPNKQAIPARIYDPYLRGQRYMILQANKLGTLGDSIQTPEIKLAKAVQIVKKILEENVLTYIPDVINFTIYPEDISLRYREEIDLNIPRECIGSIEEEEEVRWPLTEVGVYHFKVQINPGVFQDAKLEVRDPIIRVNPKLSYA